MSDVSLIAHRFVEVLNDRDLDAIDRMFDMAYWPGSLKRQLAESVAMFPDAHYTLDAVIAEGNAVALHVTMRGTNTREVEGTPATGRPVMVTWMWMFWMTGGHITRVLQIKDNLGLWTQLGYDLRRGEELESR